MARALLGEAAASALREPRRQLGGGGDHVGDGIGARGGGDRAAGRASHLSWRSRASGSRAGAVGPISTGGRGGAARGHAGDGRSGCGGPAAARAGCGGQPRARRRRRRGAGARRIGDRGRGGARSPGAGLRSGRLGLDGGTKRLAPAGARQRPGKVDRVDVLSGPQRLGARARAGGDRVAGRSARVRHHRTRHGGRKGTAGVLQERRRRRRGSGHRRRELSARRDVVHDGGRRHQEVGAPGGVRGRRRRSAGADRAGAGRGGSVGGAVGCAPAGGHAGQAAAAQHPLALDRRRSVAAAAAERWALRPGDVAGAWVLRGRWPIRARTRSSTPTTPPTGRTRTPPRPTPTTRSTPSAPRWRQARGPGTI